MNTKYNNNGGFNESKKKSYEMSKLVLLVREREGEKKTSKNGMNEK